MLDLIIRNAKLVTPGGVVEGDLGVGDGKIVQTGEVTMPSKKEIDANGKYVLPGLIDMHVHFRDPGFPEKEDFASGSQAAAAGGITTVIDMPNTNPPVLTAAILEKKRAIAQKKSLVNFGFYFGLSYDNLDEIKRAKNIAGVKVYMGSSTGDLLVQDHHVIEELFKLGVFVIVHAEDESIIRENMERYHDRTDPAVHSLIRPPRAAYEAVKAVLALAKKHSARVHITHSSTAMEVEEIKKYKSDRITADATPHHLYLTDAEYADRANSVKFNPPLRTEQDRQALWKAIKEKTIDAVATDHAPHTKAEKEQSYWNAPSGVPGVETMLPLLLNSVNHGDISLEDVVRLTSENPARILSLTKKGRIEAGYDADLVIIDLEEKREVGSRRYTTKCAWSPFSGLRLQGWPVTTIVNGDVVFEGGKVVSDTLGEEVVFSQGR